MFKILIIIHKLTISKLKTMSFRCLIALLLLKPSIHSAKVIIIILLWNICLMVISLNYYKFNKDFINIKQKGV
jgi:hypothetical protein